VGFFFVNYLGHIYFSGNDFELAYANLFGDFVKGRDFSRFPNKLQEGIRLHRSIDHYIDQHPTVKTLKSILQQDLPKVYSVAIDLYFDHLLALEWNTFYPIPLEDFLRDFYHYQPGYWKEYPPEFKHFIARMREVKWLSYYAEFYGLTKACEGVSLRLSFPNKLPEAPGVFLRYQTEITIAFHAFMADGIATFLSKR
jgi:acyl carrier protein phosphodiesterase